MPCLVLKYEYYADSILHLETFAVLNKQETKIYLKNKRLYKKIEFKVLGCNGSDYVRAEGVLVARMEIKSKKYKKYLFFNNDELYEAIKEIIREDSEYEESE